MKWYINNLKIETPNKKLHWKAALARKKKQNNIIDGYFLQQKCTISPPCKLTVCRIAPKPLDHHDNLRTAFKNIIDRIGSILMPEKKVGHADGSGMIEIFYYQRKGAVKEYAIEITIEAT